MSDPQPELREATGDVRGSAPQAAHASPMAWLRRHALVQTALLSAAVGVFLAVTGAFGLEHVSLLSRMAYFVTLAVVTGVTGALVTRLTNRWAWAEGRIGLQILAVAGIMTPIATMIVWLSTAWVHPLNPADLPYYFAISLFMSIAMTGLAFLVFRPGRRTHASAPGAPRPRFYDRLTAKVKGGELYAVQSEDHYLRLHTSRGEDLILMRLADAIGELEGVEGLQTHRSWWVARAGVAETVRADGKVSLKLKSGALAPVSRPNVAAVRQAGWM